MQACYLRRGATETTARWSVPLVAGESSVHDVSRTQAHIPSARESWRLFCGGYGCRKTAVLVPRRGGGRGSSSVKFCVGSRVLGVEEEVGSCRALCECYFGIVTVVGSFFYCSFYGVNYGLSSCDYLINIFFILDYFYR